MVFYFSATGNSFVAASKIARARKDMLNPLAECVRFHDMDFSSHDFREVGFVFPVYYGGLPTVVEQFLRQVKLPKTAYVYAVITSAGWSGKTARDTYKLLASKGVMLDRVFSITMPDNFCIGFEVKTAAESKDLLALANEDIDKCIAEISSHSRAKAKASGGERIYTYFAYPNYRYGRHTEKFWVQSDKCSHCGLCKKICPIGCIDYKNGLPVWTLQKCVQCLGCINRCPNEAIQYGKRTIKRKRYVNPIFTDVRKTPTDFD